MQFVVLCYSITSKLLYLLSSNGSKQVYILHMLHAHLGLAGSSAIIIFQVPKMMGESPSQLEASGFTLVTKEGMEISRCLCAKWLQSYPILWNSMDRSPPGSSVHGDSPGKNTGVGCHALLQGLFLTQGSNILSYVSCISRWVIYHQRHLGSLENNKQVLKYPAHISLTKPSHTETKQDPMVLALHVLSLPFVCGKILAKE